MKRKPKPLSPHMSQQEFAQRIQELLDKAQRMQDRLTAGFKYKEVWIEGHDVQQHWRKGHWQVVAFRPRGRKRKGK